MKEGEETQAKVYKIFLKIIENFHDLKKEIPIKVQEKKDLTTTEILQTHNNQALNEQNKERILK